VSESSAPGATRNLDLLGVYCNDHLAAATGGIELVSRMLGRHRGTEYEQPMEQLLDELREERAGLRATMAALGLPVREYKQIASWVAEKLSRGKLNGRVLAKRAGFETLRALAEVDRRVDGDLFHRLIDQADRQHTWLAEARRRVAASIFGGRAEAASEAADT
jgi:hypothetical protein